MKKSVLEILTKYPFVTLISIVAIAAFLIWTIGGIFADQTEIISLKQKIKSLEKNAAVAEARHKKERQDAQEIIRQQMLDIIEAQHRRDEAETRLKEKGRLIAQKNKQIAGLEDAYDKLTAPAEKIANLKSQVEEWKAQFNLCQDVIAEKDAVIFTLTDEVDGWKESFENQVKIAQGYERDWLYQKEISETKSEQIENYERMVKRLRFQVTVGKVAVGAALFFGVLRLIGIL